jgi:hypothetical protein
MDGSFVIFAPPEGVENNQLNLGGDEFVSQQRIGGFVNGRNLAVAQAVLLVLNLIVICPCK